MKRLDQVVMILEEASMCLMLEIYLLEIECASHECLVLIFELK